MSEDFTPQSASYNLGRAVGWSAYEEFLKEYASAYPELENAEPGRRLSDYVPEPVYLRAITFGVSKYLNLPTGTNAWTVEEGAGGTDYNPHLLTQIVECRGANWGCTPIIGLNYSSAQIVADIAKRRKLEKAISSIFSCESVNAQGVPVSATNRLGGYLKFYASPELKDTSIEVLPLIIRGLDVDALITEHPEEDICWGPQGLLFGGNGLTGGKTQEVAAERKILSTDLPQIYKSSPYIDFQSAAPKSFYPHEDPSRPSSWAYSGQVNYDTVKKEIELRSVDIPDGTSYLSTMITIPDQVVKDTHDNNVLKAPPSLYGDRSYADDFKGLEFAKEYVVPFDTAAPYHIRIMPHDHNISPDMYYEYQGLYCKNVVVLHETEGNAPSYIFQQLYEHDGDVKVIPVSDDTLVGIQNTIQASLVTYPMVATWVNTPADHFTMYEDHPVIGNLELRGALTSAFAEEYAFDPYPNGYTTTGTRSADLNLFNRLFVWHNDGGGYINKGIWDSMVAKDPALVADYKWIIINPGKSYRSPNYNYLVPIDKKTGRFRFVQKLLSPNGSPAWFVIRTHRYGLGEVTLPAGAFQEVYGLQYEEDARYYKNSSGQVTAASLGDAMIGYAVFKAPGDFIFINKTKDKKLSWDSTAGTGGMGEWAEEALPSGWDTYINDINNLEVFYESIHHPEISPSLKYVYDSTYQAATYHFQALPAVPSHRGNRVDPNDPSVSTDSITIRSWTSGERSIFEKAVKGVSSGVNAEVATGWRGLEAAGNSGLYPNSLITEWWTPSTGALEVEHGTSLGQYISKKQGVESVVIDGTRHRPTLNDALVSYLRLPADAWEAAMEQLTLKEFFIYGCGFTPAEYTLWEDEIFPGAAAGIKNLSIAKLMLNSFYHDLDQSITGTMDDMDNTNLDFVVIGRAAAITAINTTSGTMTLPDGTQRQVSDVSDYYSSGNFPTVPYCPPDERQGDPTNPNDSTQWKKWTNIAFGLYSVTNEGCWIVTAKFPEVAPMRPCLIEVPPEYKKPGGVQAAVGTSGLHEAWALSLTDYTGALFPTAGTAGIIPDPEDHSTISVWDDTINWTVLLEALGENKRIDVLGEALRHFKSLVIKDAGSDEEGCFYITLKNDMRIYFANHAPSASGIPDGSIGIGW